MFHVFFMCVVFFFFFFFGFFFFSCGFPVFILVFNCLRLQYFVIIYNGNIFHMGVVKCKPKAHNDLCKKYDCVGI